MLKALFVLCIAIASTSAAVQGADLEVLEPCCTEPNPIAKTFLRIAANKVAAEDSTWAGRELWARVEAVLATLQDILSELRPADDPLGKGYGYLLAYEGRPWSEWEALALRAQREPPRSPETAAYIEKLRAVFEPLIVPGDPTAYVLEGKEQPHD